MGVDKIALISLIIYNSNMMFFKCIIAKKEDTPLWGPLFNFLFNYSHKMVIGLSLVP